MNVERLVPDDAPLFVALRREMLLDTPHAFGADPATDRGSDEANVRAQLGRDGYAIFAVREGGRLVASAGLKREESPKAAHLAVIWGVYVTPSRRKKGLARAVVNAAIRHAHTWPDLLSLRLSVNAASPHAQGLYESLGFRVYGKDPGALRVAGVLYDEVMMYRPMT